MKKQVMEYASGNEMAAIAIKQIGYDLMGYYPITPSTQIAENLDIMRANGETDLVMVAAEGEHSAAGICYGASCGFSEYPWACEGYARRWAAADDRA